MELLNRYLDRSNSMSSVMSQDLVKEENLRDDLRYYFMSPCEKYRTRRHIPWKMGVQILKIVMITTQLVLFGLSNQLVVAYKEENTMALKNLFLKDYSGVDEDDFSISVYTQRAVYDSLFHVIDQYSRLGQLSVGPISYAEDEDGRTKLITICKEYYKRGNLEPSDKAYDIDAQLETVCMSNGPKTAKEWKTQNASFFDLDFYRLVDIKITFQLKGINLQTVRSRELPDCYSFNVMITFDNQCHSGLVKIFLDIDFESSACRDWKISGTAEKNTHYLLVFDGFVILVCITSAALCTRSIILAVRLLKRFSLFFHENFNRKVCEDDQKEFLNGWYVLVIISDVLAIIGSILKMEIQSKSLTSYDVCSIFLGTSTLLVWVGVIRYLGYFQKYNVLILTLKAAFPKVLRFCCCAGMIYLGYTFCGWIVLGPYHEKFEGLSRVAECLFSLLNGDDMFTTFAQLKDTNTLVWLFSRAYLYSFISLFIYMVLSLFIALITDSYETIKNYQRDGFPLTDLQKFLQEHKDFPVTDNGHTDVELRDSMCYCCYCRRYDGAHIDVKMLQ
ncbi:mucolipin-2 isoform X1 [Nothobranchius furzeri]|uniref:Mucolipin 2 n=3 Tax=Nothobranchius TaxID=28779 RepID=A0A1A8B5J3_NOTFU|nr:mucolipin-2 isoform X1 [Nothobranchius furzeri]KAF7202356.1 mucolipin-2-like [Nothobranchius furzeri]